MRDGAAAAPEFLRFLNFKFKMIMKKSKRVVPPMGPIDVADKAVVDGMSFTRDSVKESLKHDIQSMIGLAYNILNSEEMFEAMVEVIWKRYQEFEKSKKASPEIDFNDRPGVEFPKINLDDAHNAAKRQAIDELNNGR